MWKIGNIDIKNKIVLAPMADISNPSFLRLVFPLGLGLAFTELISSEAIIRDNQKTFAMLKGIEKIKYPVGIQIFGSDPKVIAKSAKILTKKYPNVFIDINMGCPVPKVALRAQAGSALLKDVNKIKEIVSSVVKSVSVPVTVKIRSGWDEKNINAVEVAKAIEEAGASAITIHARTRSQGYSGKANWEIIKKVKENVNIPVIGNGDVTSHLLAKKMLNETKCDAVMIGRGILGNPWLIKECVEYLETGKEPNLITSKERLEMLKKHFSYLIEDKNEKVALLEIRNHALWYIKGLPFSKEIKPKIFACKSSVELFNLIDEYLIMYNCK